MRDKIEQRFFIFLIMVLLFPIVQSTLNIVKEKKLNGAYEEVSKNSFDLDSWLKGDFQDKRESYINNNYGLRTEIVRFNNQALFSIFNETNANVIVGQNNYLFEQSYIDALNGKDFIGYQNIKDQLRKLKYIEKEIKRNNTELLLIIAPNKARYYNQFIPKYEQIQINNDSTNYLTYLDGIKEFNFNYIDFNRFFLDAKNEGMEYMFPKTGIHWSNNSQVMVSDTLLKKISSIFQRELSKIIVESSYYSKDPKGEDDDLERLLNLIWNISDTNKYSEFIIEDSAYFKPSVITVADSFFWGLYNKDIPQRAFTNTEFWYYYSSVYKLDASESENILAIPIVKRIFETDLVMIMCTEGNLSNFGFGFIDAVYDQLKNPERFEEEKYDQKEIERLKKEIVNNEEWMDQIKVKAKQNNVSIEEMILRDTKYMIDQRD